MSTYRTNNNKVTRQAYFVARLRDNGYVVDRVFSRYGQHDPRCWTVVIDPGGASVFITCMRNAGDVGDDCFEINDSSQFTPTRFKIVTDSIEVIIRKLHEFGIYTKSPEYDSEGPKRVREAKAAATSAATAA